MVVAATPRRHELERVLEIADEEVVDVSRAQLALTGDPSAISSFAARLEQAGFKVSGEHELTSSGLTVRERIARREGLTFYLRTV
jgi:acetolactate synthase small subunit